MFETAAGALPLPPPPPPPPPPQAATKRNSASNRNFALMFAVLVLITCLLLSLLIRLRPVATRRSLLLPGPFPVGFPSQKREQLVLICSVRLPVRFPAWADGQR